MKIEPDDLIDWAFTAFWCGMIAILLLYFTIKVLKEI